VFAQEQQEQLLVQMVLVDQQALQYLQQVYQHLLLERVE
jgi:hypothetical protein